MCQVREETHVNVISMDEEVNFICAGLAGDLGEVSDNLQIEKYHFGVRKKRVLCSYQALFKPVKTSHGVQKQMLSYAKNINWTSRKIVFWGCRGGDEKRRFWFLVSTMLAKPQIELVPTHAVVK